jgi:hypothetical protein
MDRLTKTDAETIAASIDLATTAGHNLRALLLRLADGDPWRGDARGSSRAASERGAALGLLDVVHAFALTPLGREVAERLRPVPWTSPGTNYGWLVDPSGETAGQLDRADVAEHIAELLTKADAEEAKGYRTG